MRKAKKDTFWCLATTSRRYAIAGSLNGNLLSTSQSASFRGRKILANKKRIPDAIVVLKKYIDKTGNCSIDEKIVMLYYNISI